MKMIKIYEMPTKFREDIKIYRETFGFISTSNFIRQNGMKSCEYVYHSGCFQMTNKDYIWFALRWT